MEIDNICECKALRYKIDDNQVNCVEVEDPSRGLYRNVGGSGEL